MKARAVAILSTISAATPLIASGCTREVSFSREQRVAIRQVDTLIPRGTSETRAKKALSDRGFHLSRLKPEQETNHLLLATHTKGDITWQIGLVIVDGKVAATSVTILDAATLSKWAQTRLTRR